MTLLLKASAKGMWFCVESVKGKYHSTLAQHQGRFPSALTPSKGNFHQDFQDFQDFLHNITEVTHNWINCDRSYKRISRKNRPWVHTVADNSYLLICPKVMDDFCWLHVSSTSSARPMQNYIPLLMSLRGMISVEESTRNHIPLSISPYVVTLPCWWVYSEWLSHVDETTQNDIPLLMSLRGMTCPCPSVHV
jgi:hypothetical protein